MLCDAVRSLSPYSIVFNQVEGYKRGSILRFEWLDQQLKYPYGERLVWRNLCRCQSSGLDYHHTYSTIPLVLVDIGMGLQCS